jgi:hypothetical protein
MCKNLGIPRPQDVKSRKIVEKQCNINFIIENNGMKQQ